MNQGHGLGHGFRSTHQEVLQNYRVRNPIYRKELYVAICARQADRSRFFQPQWSLLYIYTFPCSPFPHFPDLCVRSAHGRLAEGALAADPFRVFGEDHLRAVADVVGDLFGVFAVQQHHRDKRVPGKFKRPRADVAQRSQRTLKLILAILPMVDRIAPGVGEYVVVRLGAQRSHLQDVLQHLGK